MSHCVLQIGASINQTTVSTFVLDLTVSPLIVSHSTIGLCGYHSFKYQLQLTHQYYLH